ncbi:hypothetical protein [Micromonospora sp. NPDC004551]|uniref:hypothetical protein n=1 Tax=Micromonospora sp. NPDC004551 TaxID=3154284 RepID=UPI0033AA32EC
MAKQPTARRGSGAAATKNEPGNQTPNTPDVNESEIARLKVDQLRDRLRRRGVTGTADMRKPELVDTLIQALREGRKTTRSRGTTAARGTGDATPRAGKGGGSGARVPRRRSGAHDAVADGNDRQPVRVTGDSRPGVESTFAAADRVVASMVPPEVDRVDEVITPEGTILTDGPGGAAESVDSPPLPGTRTRKPRSSAGRS